MSGPRIIVPLDFATAAAALAMLDRLDPARCRVKVGKELFTCAGPALVEQIQKKGYEVFLDLKFHDIPNTVAGACRAAAGLGVWMLNVHASGGAAMLEAARAAVDKSSQRPLLTAVTVLTSLGEQDLEQIGVRGSLADQVMRLARLAHACQFDGVVCSAQEVQGLTAEFGSAFTLVTPGIRPAGSERNDQSRVMTPAAAINAGSHYLVIGRPVTAAADPLAALTAIDEEIRQVAGDQ